MTIKHATAEAGALHSTLTLCYDGEILEIYVILNRKCLCWGVAQREAVVGEANWVCKKPQKCLRAPDTYFATIAKNW